MVASSPLSGCSFLLFLSYSFSVAYIIIYVPCCIQYIIPLTFYKISLMSCPPSPSTHLLLLIVFSCWLAAPVLFRLLQSPTLKSISICICVCVCIFPYLTLRIHVQVSRIVFVVYFCVHLL